MLLKNTKGVTDVVFSHIYEKRGTLKGIFDTSFDELYYLELNSIIAENIVNKKYDEKFVDNELNLAEKHGIKLITREEETYPERLNNIYCPPAYLYIKGNVQCLKEYPIAIVGSRKPSKAAEIFTYQIAEDLSSVGMTVISGFAYGIDIASHLGAVKKGSTAVILGSGFLNIYPKTHAKYMDSILDKGCFVTEYPFNEQPLAYNFPRRNRIISGLSMGVLIVEAAKQSGTLITARFALEQNRIVFAVPHFPGSYNSAVNDLLRDGAVFTESYLDIIREFKDTINKEKTKKEWIEFSDPLEKNIYDAIVENPASMDELCILLNVGIVEVMITVAQLELADYIVKDESGKYIPVKGAFDG